MNGLASTLSLRGKVALALALVFLGSLGVLLLVLSPVLGEQRQRLLEQDRHLLSTLRRNYEREFVYDLLSRNRESLAVHLADLASQEGLLWARIQSGDLDLGASADRAVVLRLIGPDAEPYGRLHLLKSLQPLERSERLTRSLLYGGVSLSFVAVLLLLNWLLSRMVLAPVRRVHDAMSRAATGDLRVRLEVPSRDEVGSIAESFNRMVGELEASRQQVEGYSRNLESMVEARTAELRASEASLLRLKNHLATVIANVGTGVLSLDQHGRIETFNGRAGEILGLDPESARGRPLEAVLAGPENERLVEAVALVRDGREESHERQVTCALPQGRRTLSVVVKALHGEGRRSLGTVVVVEDLTQILASQRLEAWKEAVERVIHEIKNPLTPVGLAGETLRTAWASDPARFAEVFPSAIDMILGAVRDLKELIGEFSRFSRLPPMRPERLDPNGLVRAVLAPYTKAPPEHVRVTTELAADAPQVEADADQIKRVLLNVINNALEAMGEKGGTLRLSTRRERDGVLILVEDDGPGVEDVERIFEPHYTTKVQGTGLGLAIARQIVDEHGGTIRAESQPGKGTSVHIYLSLIHI